MILRESQRQRDEELAALLNMEPCAVAALPLCTSEAILIYDGPDKPLSKEEMEALYRDYRALDFNAYLRTLMQTSVERRHPELTALISLMRDKRCLDFGSGVGTHAIALLENGNEVWLLDVAGSPLLEFARRRIARRGFAYVALTDSARLPAEFFDVAICTDTLEHAHDPVGELARITASLKRGGMLHLQVSNMVKPSSGHFAQSIVRWRAAGPMFLDAHYARTGRTLYRRT